MSLLSWWRYRCTVTSDYHFCDQHSQRCMHCSKALPGASWCQRVTPRELQERVEHGHRKSGADTRSTARAVQPGPRDSAGAEPIASAGAVDRGAPCPSVVVATEVIGWRSWDVQYELGAFLDADYYLTSWRGTRWDGPVLTADVVPTRENTNGVYARPEGWTPGYHGYVMSPLGGASQRVYGRVALTGIVVECEQGYRAERATVRDLWVLNSHPGTRLNFTTALEQRYACATSCGVPPFDAWYQL